MSPRAQAEASRRSSSTERFPARAHAGFRVRLWHPPASPAGVVGQPALPDVIPPDQAPAPRLTTRQKHVLALVLESGSAGPSIVSKELGVGLSTAYRDLASLEEMGLIQAEGGKRTLTTEGLHFLGGFTPQGGSATERQRHVNGS